MDNEVIKKVKNTNNLAKNKSSSKKTTTSTKKKSSKSSSTNKKSAPKKNVSTKTSNSKKSTSTVKNTNTKSTNNTKKKTTTKKSNTYQYNKRNLDKNKKVKEEKVVKEELVDESIHLDNKVINQEKFSFVEDKNTESIEDILDGIDLDKNIKTEEELEYTGLINTVEDNEVPEKFEKEIIEDILGDKDALDEIEVLDVSTKVDEKDIEKEFEREEILDELLTDEEKVSIREEEIIEDILEEKEDKKEEFYPFDEEEIELESETREEDLKNIDDDPLFKTLRIDLYDVYDKDNDYSKDNASSKTVESVDDKFLLVDNILTEETRQNIIPDNVFVKEDKEDEYYNVMLWDSIIGVLIVIFTVLVIFAIWFMVYLTTY